MVAVPTMLDHWTDEAAKHLAGRTIKTVRYMRPDEAKSLGWEKLSLVLELDNGTLLFPSRDDEGNDAGAMFGQDNKGPLTFPTLRQ